MLYEEEKKGTYSKIAISPFVVSEPKDFLSKAVYDTFSSAVQKESRFQVSSETPSSDHINIDSAEEVGKQVQSLNLDGMFVGKLSGPIGDNRLLQVKFYGKDRKAFVIEKVTKISLKGDLQKSIQTLVDSCIKELFTN